MRYVTAVLLALSGYIHADLYLHGYRVIPLVGPAFLLQASGSFAIAVLLLFGNALIPRLAAAGLAVGALVGFVVSRTLGIGAFIEHGFDPAPQALISVLAEVAVLALLVVAWRIQPSTAGARATS
jgi:hypothetical protein